MTTKKIWHEVGGLSEYLKPMYFEDTDLSFKIRAAGYKTYYIPSSIVYHHEGLTSGTDTSSGFKRFQEINRPKFKKAWSKSFSGHNKDGVEPDLEKDRGIIGRALFIDPAIGYLSVIVQEDDIFTMSCIYTRIAGFDKSLWFFVVNNFDTAYKFFESLCVIA